MNTYVCRHVLIMVSIVTMHTVTTYTMSNENDPLGIHIDRGVDEQSTRPELSLSMNRTTFQAIRLNEIMQLNNLPREIGSNKQSVETEVLRRLGKKRSGDANERPSNAYDDTMSMQNLIMENQILTNLAAVYAENVKQQTRSADAAEAGNVLTIGGTRQALWLGGGMLAMAFSSLMVSISSLVVSSQHYK